MEWFEAKRLPVSIDLEPVLRAMQSENIPCWISEDSGEQIVWLQSQTHLEPLSFALQAQREGKLQVPQAIEQTSAVFTERKWRDIPVTLVALALSLLGAILIYVDVNLQWVHWLTFNEVLVRGNSLYFTDLSYVIKEYQFWRFLTPVFLHFGLFHILFNALWLWEMGRRIEQKRGSLALIMITLFAGVASNFLQYAMSGPSFFGGMSGVLYGYLGYIWMWQKYRPSQGFGLPSGVIGFMLLWLVIGFTGFIDGFMDGQIANGAHLGGLLCGICIGVVGVIASKLNTQDKQI